jgi:putative transposase
MLNEKEKNELAAFRFGIISEFVTGVELSYGEKEKLLKEKSNRFYVIPFSSKKTIAKSSILSWIRRYKEGGKRIEALYPKARKDKGNFRKLDKKICEEIKNLRRSRPNLTVPIIIKILKQNKILSMDENIRLPSIYRFLKKENLGKINLKEPDRRKFETEFPNQIWQGDIMHGPRVRINGINKKSYLNAFIDDHSRFIIYAKFYPNEKLESLKDCLRQAIQTRGLPQKIYVDNGSCYSAINLDQITACLGIGITHSRPYTPQGRGKIERWFKNIREGFLPYVSS